MWPLTLARGLQSRTRTDRHRLTWHVCKRCWEPPDPKTPWWRADRPVCLTRSPRHLVRNKKNLYTLYVYWFVLTLMTTNVCLCELEAPPTPHSSKNRRANSKAEQSAEAPPPPAYIQPGASELPPLTTLLPNNTHIEVCKTHINTIQTYLITC